MAKLKAFLPNLDGLDDTQKAFYVKTDEGFVLDLDDKDFKSKINEFRSNNKSLMDKLDESAKTLEKFKDIDPEKYQEGLVALEKQRQIAEKKMIEGGKVDELIAQRTIEMKKEHDKILHIKDTALQKATKDRDTLKFQLDSMKIEREILEAVNKVGKLRQGAAPDVLARARSTWKSGDDGILRAFDEKGEARYGKDAIPMKPHEWAEELIDIAPHLFESPKGGGAQGGEKPLPGHGKVIAANDPIAFGKNLEAIVKGEVAVK